MLSQCFNRSRLQSRKPCSLFTSIALVAFLCCTPPAVADDAPSNITPAVSNTPETPAIKPAEKNSFLGSELTPGTLKWLYWGADAPIEGIVTSTPVLISNGAQAGPTLCLTAAVHGDELNGVEIIRKVIHELDPRELSGRVIGGTHCQSSRLPQ